MINKKTKMKQKKIILLAASLFILAILLYYHLPKEVIFEEVYFEDFKKEFTNESVPFILYFTVINPQFNAVYCKAVLSLSSEGKEINKTQYYLGKIGDRTKIKYKIPFNMPRGNTKINLDRECKKYKKDILPTNAKNTT